jgi:hypothetical protein
MASNEARLMVAAGVALASLLGAEPAARAEAPPPWRREVALGLPAAARDALSAAPVRGWSSYPVDEAYAGPWADSPFARVASRARDPVATGDRGAARPPDAAGRAGGRAVEGTLASLGPLGLFASALIPVVMASSAVASGGRSETTLKPRVGVARLPGGYGVVFTARFF